MFTRKSAISLAKPLVDRFPRIATAYRSVRDQLDCMDAPITTPWGFKLAGNVAMAQGHFEPVETSFVRENLKNVEVLVNVGANVGYYCCHALAMGRSVVAFEPIQRNLRYLCKNIRANNWSGAEIYPVALSSRVDILDIYGGNTGASVVKGWAGIPESYTTLVPSLTMDLVLGGRLHGRRSLILIDVEGAEKSVLEGAALTLRNDPMPIWIIEVVATDHQPSGVQMNPNLKSTFQLLFNAGYQAFCLDKDMRPVTAKDVELLGSGLRSFPTHNFVFTGVG